MCKYWVNVYILHADICDISNIEMSKPVTKPVIFILICSQIHMDKKVIPTYTKLITSTFYSP